MDAERAIFL